MRDYPNLFPSLTPAERELMAIIAGNAEALPQLIDRLVGYAADLSKARPQTPALVTPLLPDALTGNLPSRVNDPVPLFIDTLGRLQTVGNRRAVTDLPVRIPAGAQVSKWYRVTPEIRHTAGILSYDAPNRVAAELITLQFSLAPLPDPAVASPDARTFGNVIHTATLGTVAGLTSGAVATAEWFRYSSAVPVGAADLVFILRINY